MRGGSRERARPRAVPVRPRHVSHAPLVMFFSLVGAIFLAGLALYLWFVWPHDMTLQESNDYPKAADVTPLEPEVAPEEPMHTSVSPEREVPIPTEEERERELSEAPKPVEVPVLAQPVRANSRGVGLSLGETLSVVSEEELRRRFDDMAAIGVAWIRVDFAWSSIEPVEGEYRWAATDRIVREARSRGIRVLGLLTYTPPWARAEACAYTKMCEPFDPDTFARFAAAAASRYAPEGVYAWEIWNEPNLKLFWAAGASPERYAALLQRTAKVVKNASPSAFIVSGGLAAVATRNGSMAAREFLERVYAAGAGDSFDAVGYHPYSYPLAPHFFAESSPWSQMAETEWSIRSIMRENSDDAKKIWITEYGAPTGGPGLAADTSVHDLSTSPTHVTEAFQAIMLREAFEENAAYNFTGPLFWYSYRDLDTSNATVEHHFGIRRADGSPKPAYDALRAVP